MKDDQPKTGFQGLLVGALESRMATEMERLIIRHGGVPVVAPSIGKTACREESAFLSVVFGIRHVGLPPI